jgi:D-serine deaminase-like pyridoxal phosphate-dependent protein
VPGFSALDECAFLLHPGPRRTPAPCSGRSARRSCTRSIIPNVGRIRDRLAVSAATNGLGRGDKIRLIPGHCDPTVNLYDWYVCARGSRVEQRWPITAGGDVS